MGSPAAALAGAPLQPVRATAAVAHDADDPAIWISPRNPAESLIVGTDKAAQTGGLYVFSLDGVVRQVIQPLDRPNNVDIEYALALRGTPTDIAVVTERKRHRLRVFAIRGGEVPLTDLAPEGIPVLEGQSGDAGEPMGIALYRRARDGAVFAIVAPKTGAATNYLWQYRLEGTPEGSIRGQLVRRFGAFSGVGPQAGSSGEIEAITVDDALGYVYYSDERYGIRKYAADPAQPDAGRELAVLGSDGYLGDREGLAIYPTGEGTGYLVSSDQISGGTRLVVYPREGLSGRPHDQPRLTEIPTVSDETDGLDVVARAVPGFPHGLVVMMNSGARTFLMYDWDAVRSRIP